MSLTNNSIIKLNSDIEVSVVRFHQFETYEGLLIGLPDEKRNQKIISWNIEYAKKISELESVFLIEPRQTIIKNQASSTSQSKIEYKELPYITCIMKVTSTNVTNAENDSAFMCIVWFQNDFAFPIEAEILKTIKNIPFKEKCIYQSNF